MSRIETHLNSGHVAFLVLSITLRYMYYESLSFTTNLGEAIPVPAPACLCIYAKGRAILGAPALRTGVGRLKSLSNLWELSLPMHPNVHVHVLVLVRHCFGGF